jgi:hypothetical protein
MQKPLATTAPDLARVRGPFQHSCVPRRRICITGRTTVIDRAGSPDRSAASRRQSSKPLQDRCSAVSPQRGRGSIARGSAPDGREEEDLSPEGAEQ